MSCGALVLLYLEPLWIAAGAGVLVVALVLHLVLSRGGPDAARQNDGS